MSLADQKAAEHLRYLPLGFHTRGRERIEIVDARAMPGGLEVFFRGWRDDRQRGFGVDGTSDVERLQIVNPPMRRAHSVERPTPAPVLVADVFRVLRLVGKPGDLIIQNRYANTTLTARPLNGTGTAPIDGTLQRGGVDEDFDTIRAGAGTHVFNTVTTIIAQLSSTTTTDQYSTLRRVGVGFPLSAIAGRTLVSATIELWGTTSATGLGNVDGVFVAFTPSDGTDFPTSDFAIGNFGSTDLTDRINTADWVTGDFNLFTLTAAGLAYIDPDDDNYFGWLVAWDADNNFTGSWSSNTGTNFTASSADDGGAGTTQDPVFTGELAEFSTAAAIEDEVAPEPDVTVVVLTGAAAVEDEVGAALGTAAPVISKTMTGSAEHLAAAQQTEIGSAEHTVVMSQVEIGLSEHLAPVDANRTTSAEHLAVSSGAVSPGTEHLAAAQQAGVIHAEHLERPLRAISHGAEHLAVVSQVETIATEHLLTEEFTWTMLAEHVAAVGKSKLGSAEHVGPVSQAKTASAEYLGAVQKTAMIPSEHEAAAGLIQKQLIGATEHIASIIKTLVVPAEHLLSIEELITASTEHLAEVAAARGVPAEHLARVETSIVGLGEHLAAVVQTLSGGAEHTVIAGVVTVGRTIRRTATVRSKISHTV